VKPRLYVIPASPPCACIEAALTLKGVEYDVTDLPPVLHVPHQLLRFGAPTVPAMKLDGSKIVGSRAIARQIDERWPEPPLYGRTGVDEAEAWGDETLQPVGRRLVWWAMKHCHAAMPSFLEGSKLPLPPAAARAAAPLTAPLGALRNGSTDEAVRADLQALPGHLDRIEGWIDAGVIGTDEPTAADLQIGSVLGILLAIQDVGTIIQRSERATALSRRWFPSYPGHVPAGVVPAAWIP
jgi:glutathione S-transferase